MISGDELFRTVCEEPGPPTEIRLVQIRGPHGTLELTLSCPDMPRGSVSFRSPPDYLQWILGELLDAIPGDGP